MTPEKIAELNEAIINNDHDTFGELVGDFTACELDRLGNTLDKNLTYMLWSCSVSWGFEVTWASYLTMNDETKQECLKEFPDMDFEVPENFDGNVPLKNLYKWAPQDHVHRLYACN